ncbi:hypothetical protein [Lactobacillus intestinalis]|uniref:hypothetical protein n=1 Tax=Lactobacillus intestinalis TaxID=151781 RepID=UPI0025B19EAB|nr:hypothetical protein [Lactobacillus intestinalis]
MKKIDGETLQHFRLDNIQVNKVQREIKKYNMTKAEFYRMVVDDYFKTVANLTPEYIDTLKQLIEILNVIGEQQKRIKRSVNYCEDHLRIFFDEYDGDGEEEN